MSNDFNSKIHSLSNKLNNLNKPNRKHLKLQQVKEHLSTLEDSLHKQLNNAQKRIERIQAKLSKKVSSSKRAQLAINNVWSEKEERVSEMIGSWVQNYEEQVQFALLQLQRQQRNYQMKLQEEQQVISKQVRMQENRVKDLIHTAEREISKLQFIHSQQQDSIIKQIALAKQLLQQSMANSQQVMHQRQQTVQHRLQRMRTNILSLQNSLKADLAARQSKLKQIMILLLDIE